MVFSFTEFHRGDTECPGENFLLSAISLSPIACHLLPHISNL